MDPKVRQGSLRQWLGVERTTGGPHLAALIDVFDLLGVINDVEGVIRHVNPSFLKSTGWTYDEIVGRPYLDTFFDPERAKVLRQVFFPALKRKQAPHRLENEILRRDGVPILVSWHNAVLEGPSGEPVGLLSLGEDVGYRRRSVALLKAERAALDAISRGRSLREVAMPLLDVIQRYGGVVRAELVFRGADGELTVFDAAGGAQTLRVGGRQAFAEAPPDHEASARWLELQQLTPFEIRDEHGAVLGELRIELQSGRGGGVHVLVERLVPSLRLSMEHHYRTYTREKLLRAMAPSLEDDPFQRCLRYLVEVVAVEAAALLLQGAGAEASSIELIEAGEPLDWRAWIDEVGGTAHAWSTWGSAPHQPGIARTVHGKTLRVLGVVVRGEHGSLGLLLVAFAVDRPFQAFLPVVLSVLASWISASLTVREAEEARARLEERALQAQKLESLGVLAGGIAHDFNNMLTGILGNASLALRAVPPGSPLFDLLRDIETAGVRAAELTKQMLAYSGRGRFVIEPVDLSALVAEMNHLLRSVISKNAIIKLDLEKDLPKISGDATQIRQVVMNLITNASDAIGDARGTLSIRTGCGWVDAATLQDSYVDDDLPQGEYIYLEVSDTGIGMNSETQERIFEPFFTTKFAGRGLGLAAVLGIVRSHRGALKLQSEPGQGTSFRVFFPRADQDPAPIAASSRKALEPASLGVLVVDDDDAARAVARRMLRRAGFGVFSVSDGVEALGTYRDHRADIHVVLLDLTMPGMDGAEVLEALRATDAEVRVVLSSGYSEQEATGRLAGRGEAVFLQKPFRYDDLVDAIARAVER
ncbi:MAG: PAS domain-containing hybrid sensor histidine kinase/response regulator [Deltaproteobacteria bacterium]|nr:MAG: PAS domain-containing hybrid sensor histidine kinase/response regulator [Deltaproteobacteria bacterium]